MRPVLILCMVVQGFCARMVGRSARYAVFSLLGCAVAAGPALSQSLTSAQAEIVSKALLQNSVTLEPIKSPPAQLSFAGAPEDEGAFYLRHYKLLPANEDGIHQTVLAHFSISTNRGRFGLEPDVEATGDNIWRASKALPNADDGHLGFLIFVPNHKLDQKTLKRWADRHDDDRVRVFGTQYIADPTRKNPLSLGMHCLTVRARAHGSAPNGRNTELQTLVYQAQKQPGATGRCYGHANLPDPAPLSEIKGSFWAQVEHPYLEQLAYVLVLQGKDQSFPSGPASPKTNNPQPASLSLVFLARDHNQSADCRALWSNAAGATQILTQEKSEAYPACVTELDLPDLIEMRSNGVGKVANGEYKIDLADDDRVISYTVGDRDLSLSLQALRDAADADGKVSVALDLEKLLGNQTHPAAVDESDELAEQIAASIYTGPLFAEFLFDTPSALEAIEIKQGDHVVSLKLLTTFNEEQDNDVEGVFGYSRRNREAHVARFSADSGLVAGQANLTVRRRASSYEYTCDTVQVTLAAQQRAVKELPKVECREQPRFTTLLVPEGIKPGLLSRGLANIEEGACKDWIRPTGVDIETLEPHCISGFRSTAGIMLEFESEKGYSIQDEPFAPDQTQVSNGFYIPELQADRESDKITVSFSGGVLDRATADSLNATSQMAEAVVKKVTPTSDGTGLDIELAFETLPIDEWLEKDKLLLKLTSNSSVFAHSEPGSDETSALVEVALPTLEVLGSVPVQAPSLRLPQTIELTNAMSRRKAPMYWCDFGVRLDGYSDVWYTTDIFDAGLVQVSAPDLLNELELTRDTSVSLVTRPRLSSAFPTTTAHAEIERNTAACLPDTTEFLTLTAGELAEMTEVSVPMGPLILAYFQRDRATDAAYDGEMNAIYQAWLTPIGKLRMREVVVLRQPVVREFVTKVSPLAVQPFSENAGIDGVPFDRNEASSAPDLETVLEDAEKTRREMRIPDHMPYGVVVFQREVSDLSCEDIARETRGSRNAAQIVLVADITKANQQITSTVGEEVFDWSVTQCPDSSVTLLRTNTLFVHSDARRHVSYSQALEPILSELSAALRL